MCADEVSVQRVGGGRTSSALQPSNHPRPTAIVAICDSPSGAAARIEVGMIIPTMTAATVTAAKKALSAMEGPPDPCCE